jgi:hypothetical protein
VISETKVGEYFERKKSRQELLGHFRGQNRCFPQTKIGLCGLFYFKKMGFSKLI